MNLEESIVQAIGRATTTNELALTLERLIAGGFAVWSDGSQIEAMKSKLDDLVVALTHSGTPVPSPPADKKEILLLKPSLWGMGIDLKALWRRWFNNRA